MSTVNADTAVKEVPPDMDRADFIAELERVGSPAAAAAGGVYDFAVQRRLSPSFLLAMFHHESNCGTNPAAICVAPPTPTHSWGNTVEPSFGDPGLGRPFVRGRFTRYAGWREGGVSTVARLFEHAPYHGKTTVRELIEIWAPPIENHTERYIASVVATMNRLRQRRRVSMGQVPKPPIVESIIGIPPKVDGVGVDRIAGQRKPLFSCVHSMVGTLMGTDGHFRRPEVEALTDFGIGLADTGDGFAEIRQWCDPFGSLVPWANGVVRNPDGDGLRVIQQFGIGEVNKGGVSIELDDNSVPRDDQGRPTTPVSAAQWSSLCWLLAFIHAEWLGQTADSFDWNLHHREFATKDCPFPRVYDFTVEYQTAVKAIMRHWQEGADYPAGGVVVAGKRLTVPTQLNPDLRLVIDGGLGPGTTENVRAFINERGETIVEINYGGKAKQVQGVNLVDVGVSVENDAGEVFDRSVQANVFRPWTKR